MERKICLITGATDGIGKQTALDLAKMGAHVVLVGRNPAKTETAVSEIKQKTGNSNVDYLLADFASQAQIRQLAANYLAKYDRLDVLVNNAGLLAVSRQETEDGLEMMFGVNHIGYFLLTTLLLDLILQNENGRIVNVASDAHAPVSLNFDDLQNENSFSSMRVYGQSKLANIYFTYELSRRLADSPVTVNCLHPGFVATNMGANNIPYIGGAIKKVLNLFAGRNVQDGAATSVYLASSPEVANVTGKYFVDCQPIRSSDVSYDETIAKQLWEVSEAIVEMEVEFSK